MPSLTVWSANISWAPVLSSAIRLEATPPDTVPCAGNRDGRYGRGRRQSASVKFLHSLGANRSLSRPKPAIRKPTPEPKGVDGLRSATGAWGVPLPDFRFSVGNGCWPGSQTRGVGLNAHSVLQTQFGEDNAELSTFSVPRICQDHSRGNLLLQRLSNLLPSNLRLGLKRNLFRNSPISRRSASSHHSSGRYNRHAIGRLEFPVLTDKLTWQSDLPNSPQYRRATPTECFPCLGKPV